MPAKTYRHKTIRRFRVGKFEFKNHKLVIESEEDQKAFEEMIAGLPPIDSQPIVIVNAEAAAAAEKPLVSPVVRGAMSADDILTAKDKERIQSGAGTAQIPANIAALMAGSNK